MLKERIFEEIDRQKERLCEMADTIFDHPECDGEEMMAADLLCGYLAENGFSVERPIAGLKSAFRAVYHSVGNGAAPPASASSASMTLWPGWGMGAGTICRDRPAWARRWR